LIFRYFQNEEIQIVFSPNVFNLINAFNLLNLLNLLNLFKLFQLINNDSFLHIIDVIKKVFFHKSYKSNYFSPNHKSFNLSNNIQSFNGMMKHIFQT
jgi:hypothetical protein